MDEVRQLILERSAQLKRSLAEVSKKINRNHAYLQQFIHRGIPQDLPEKVRPALAKELGVSEDSLRGRESHNRVNGVSQNNNSMKPKTRGKVDERNPESADQSDSIPGSQLIGGRDLPVFGTSQGGKGAGIVSSDPVDWVARPEPLARVKDGYGIIVTGDSMIPAFMPGDIALVNPHLPARSGDTCVFRGEAPDGTFLSCIKFLRRQTADCWLVTEWNSDEGTKRDFTLKKSEWQLCHVTVGRYNRR